MLFLGGMVVISSSTLALGGVMQIQAKAIRLRLRRRPCRVNNLL